MIKVINLWLKKLDSLVVSILKNHAINNESNAKQDRDHRRNNNKGLTNPSRVDIKITLFYIHYIYHSFFQFFRISKK